MQFEKHQIHEFRISCAMIQESNIDMITEVGWLMRESISLKSSLSQLLYTYFSSFWSFNKAKMFWNHWCTGNSSRNKPRSGLFPSDSYTIGHFKMQGHLVKLYQTQLKIKENMKVPDSSRTIKSLSPEHRTVTYRQLKPGIQEINKIV